jgi:predicted transcriptional regulator
MPKSIGDQELALLRHVAEGRGATVGEVAEGYGAARGLARSTVLTMMERLRQKGFLSRRRGADGVFRYTSRASAGDLLRSAVRDFVANTLDGEVSPVVAYLVEDAEVSDTELAELEALVDRLQARRKEGGR